MRDLYKFENRKIKIIATVGEKGSFLKDGKKQKTRCLVNLYYHNKLLADHCWTWYTEDLKGIKKGTKILFTATPVPYYKYVNGIRTKEFKVDNVTDIVIISE